MLSGAAVGLIPLAIGVGFLIDYQLQKRDLSRFGLEVGRRNDVSIAHLVRSALVQEGLMELIKDKVAIVTGAAAGIGAGVASYLPRREPMYFSSTWTGAGQRKSPRICRRKGGSAFGFEADARNRDAMAKSLRMPSPASDASMC